MNTTNHHIIVDPATKGEFWVTSLRKLSAEEVSEVVSAYLLSRKNKRPKPGERIRVFYDPGPLPQNRNVPGRIFDRGSAVLTLGDRAVEKNQRFL